MNESTRTSRFVIAAAVMLVVAMLTYWFNLPPKISDYDLVGTPFFESFESGSQAESLEVYALDSAGKLQQFAVKKTGGVWTIPSHYDYPAEATERLAAAATSLVGLTRQAMAGRLVSEHERLGVLDPTAEENTDPDSTGTRLVLKDRTGDVLADLIIGKQAESQVTAPRDRTRQEEPTPTFYVRQRDENQTFKVALELDLSTRFADWIDDRLLGITNNDLRYVNLNNYQLRERALDPLGQQIGISIVPGEIVEFRRETGFGPWTLDGMDTDAEVMDTSKLNELLTTITELKITGVRPKFRFEGQQLLTADLKMNRIPELEENPELFQRAFMRMAQELSTYGFMLAPNPKNQEELMLVSDQGELSFGTENGVRYLLNFGKMVSGDEQAIEIGLKSDEPAAADDTTEETIVDGDESADKPKNRYVMIRVMLDENLLGPELVEPIAPTEPVKPDGYQPKSETDAAAQATDESDEVDGPPKPPQDVRDPRFVIYDEAMKQYETDKAQYELQLIRYQDELKERQERIERAETIVADLSDRYGAWFYVVSGEKIASLSIQRSDFVQPAARQDDGPALGLPLRPDIRFDDLDESATDDETDDSGDSDQSDESVDSGDGENAKESDGSDQSGTSESSDLA